MNTKIMFTSGPLKKHVSLFIPKEPIEEKIVGFFGLARVWLVVFLDLQLRDEKLVNAIGERRKQNTKKTYVLNMGYPPWN